MPVISVYSEWDIQVIGRLVKDEEVWILHQNGDQGIASFFAPLSLYTNCWCMGWGTWNNSGSGLPIPYHHCLAEQHRLWISQVDHSCLLVEYNPFLSVVAEFNGSPVSTVPFWGGSLMWLYRGRSISWTVPAMMQSFTALENVPKWSRIANHPGKAYIMHFKDLFAHALPFHIQGHGSSRVIRSFSLI